ncbi:hypothetical protein [Rhodococcus sp. NPDC058514]|uniref:hypothetical protein n=1 Tax=unclassified Rhodococcus (in: high G+C Gram-positive bacteria) TaxID=192944 RepID=UPI003646C3F2
MAEEAESAQSAGPDGPAGLAGLSRQDRLEQLRRRMAAVPARGESVAARPVVSQPAESSGLPRPAGSSPDVLPVPPALASLLPRGGLARGSVVSVAGAGSLLLGLLASVTEAGGHAAVIGLPRLGLLAATEMGAELGRLALIPDPGPDPVEVAAVLLDGLDLVVLGLGGLAVPPSRARAVVARARSKGSTLVVTGGHWDGAEIRLEATVCGYDGMGQGAELGRGRLRALRLAVSARGRAFQPRTTRLDLRPVRGRVEWMEATPRQPGALPDVVSL